VVAELHLCNVENATENIDASGLSAATLIARWMPARIRL